jgi:hypothetical protein
MEYLSIAEKTLAQIDPSQAHTALFGALIGIFLGVIATYCVFKFHFRQVVTNQRELIEVDSGLKNSYREKIQVLEKQLIELESKKSQHPQFLNAFWGVIAGIWYLHSNVSTRLLFTFDLLALYSSSEGQTEIISTSRKKFVAILKELQQKNDALSEYCRKIKNGENQMEVSALKKFITELNPCSKAVDEAFYTLEPTVNQLLNSDKSKI